MYQHPHEQQTLSVDLARGRTTAYEENRPTATEKVSFFDRLLGQTTKEKRDELAYRIHELV